MKYERVAIPSNCLFLEQWHKWIHGKVACHFKRDRHRIPDTVQSVRLRLLSKDFIGRWFFKHLTNELVDKTQAELMLGGVKITFIGTLNPVDGKRSSPDSVWRVSDLLEFAKFDYDRYYYSIQGHTIASDKVLNLLGYPEGSYGALESLYRQGRLKPSELTSHQCTGEKSCIGCIKGKASLKEKKLSLAHRWDDPEVRGRVKKLRWCDSQLKGFLRDWRKQNRIKCVPDYVMRVPPHRGIDAGLLGYAEMVISNATVNSFKRLTRNDDMARMVFNDGISPESSDVEVSAWESDGDDLKRRVIIDVGATGDFDDFENREDVRSVIDGANLTPEEKDAITAVDLMSMTVKQYAIKSGKASPRVHKVRASALKKLRASTDMDTDADLVVRSVCQSHSLTRDELFSLSLFGASVIARTELFTKLYRSGMSVEDMKSKFMYPESRILAALNRGGVLS